MVDPACGDQPSRENFRCLAVLLVPMSRLLVILTLLAAALPAAAGAQTPAEPPVAVTGAADSRHRDDRQPQRQRRSERHRDHLPLRVRHLRRLRAARRPDADAGSGTDPVAVKAPITGLTRDTIYHYRLVATNGTGPVSRGADRTFRTATGPQPPRVKATGSREVQSRSALLITQVDPNAQATTVRFEYGRSTGYGSHTATIDAGDDRRLQAVLDGDRPAAAEHALPLPRRRDQRRGHHAQPRPLVRDHARADRHQRSRSRPARSSWGRT